MTGSTRVSDILPNERVTQADDHIRLREALAGSAVGAPESVVHPESVDEVAEVLRWASAEGVGVLPLCSGRRLSLASEHRSEGRWIALATDRLSGIEIYEAADLTVTAGAGTPMSTVDTALRANQQWAPFDPPHVLERSLGGLAADAAAGPLWMGYGELRNHVLGMTVVTGDGRVLRLGGRVVKNVAGFDLLKPMTGSRGSLAVIASVTLRAFPEPFEDRLLTLSAPTIDALLDAALKIGTAPVLPVSCVVVDTAAEPPIGGLPATGARLLVRLHGARSTVAADQRTLEAHLGSALEEVGQEHKPALLGRMSDRGEDAPMTVEASVRPSRLTALWSALKSMEPTEFAIDAYSGLARIGLASATGPAMDRLTGAAESLGGAVRVAHAPTSDLRRRGSVPSPDEESIIGRLREAFDPQGVLWPARR